VKEHSDVLTYPGNHRLSLAPDDCWPWKDGEPKHSSESSASVLATDTWQRDTTQRTYFTRQVLITPAIG